MVNHDILQTRLTLFCQSTAVVLSSRNQAKLEQVPKTCPQQRPDSTTKISIVPYDATSNKEQIDATVDEVLKVTQGRIDLLILNAGVYQNQPALKTTKKERDAILQINYQAPVDLTESFLPKSNWKERGQGHIVVVASVMAHGPHGLSSSYAASKAALRNYFFSLSTEEISWLRIDVACPGGTATGLWDSLDSQPSLAAVMQPDRVAHLILTGVAGPHLLFFETWISRFSNLLWVYLRHWTPTLFHWFTHLMAYVRVPVWEHEKIDLLDTPELVQKLILIVMGRYP